MIVVGVVGPIGAGKDAAAEYIAKKYGFRVVSYRDIVREATEKEGLEPNRENMQKTARAYRDKYGEDVFANLALEKAKKLGEKVLLKEMRTPGDIEVPKKYFGKKLAVIAVDAKLETRFRRLKSRGRLGDPKTIEKFRSQDEKEIKLGYYEGIKLADFKVDNDGSLEELHKKIDKIIKEII